MPKRRLQGTVVSNKMEKTAVVTVERLKAHPLYHKVVRRRKKFMAHDEANDAQIGDVVVIEECRPFSKNKTWQIVTVVERRGGDA
jgi:small subunit ribosomal protein S17